MSRRPAPKDSLCYDLPPVVTISAGMLERLQLAEIALANVRAEVEEVHPTSVEPDSIVCVSRIRRHLALFDAGHADPPTVRRRYHDDG